MASNSFGKIRRFDTNQQVTSYNILCLWVFITRVMSYELLLLYELRATFRMRITSYWFLYELQLTFYIRITDCCVLHQLQMTFIIRVTSCFANELRIAFYCTSYKVLLYELRVTFFCTIYELLFACEFSFISRVTSCLSYARYRLLFIARVRFTSVYTSYKL